MYASVSNLTRVVLLCVMLVAFVMPQPLVFAACILALIFLTGRLFVCACVCVLFYALYASHADTVYLVAAIVCAIVVALVRANFTFA
jgi:hypothetical protein